MKISGPILDRIDIQVQVKPLRAHEMIERKSSESSKVIKERILKARLIQNKRRVSTGVSFNARLTPHAIKQFCQLTGELENIMVSAVKRYSLSARSYYKILKVARTIADLDNRESIARDDILEALAYREVEQILYSKNELHVSA